MVKKLNLLAAIVAGLMAVDVSAGGALDVPDDSDGFFCR
jgi:hypothetical protein